MSQPVKADDYQNYEALLREARDYTGKLLFDKPKNWEQRKYINRLKRQQNYYKNKESKVVKELKRKEKKAEQRLDRDLDIFTNLQANSLYSTNSFTEHLGPGGLGGIAGITDSV